ncbi:putative Late embryogenesis abundant protein [Helianthus annuus]|uniref:Late embryogenesis abundant protein, LEA_2 subgroup n=1 Tax=Helianthus annuus TaxID=4232 RepID=A0A251SPJ4_HELAN|nr:late embryogenesis abundant protein At1g64065 [Helianthus annuus]KAF5772478.1 putative Late embryogenesis abundant protein, LEA_2 subgroup [Helianthus annuus]KAJ0476098.1 putative Late embryogenesis abundant protein [Helianthus annuus]KAJ0480162.1 putative Late embryogenesis abundant protein [Helianthus annuus]KAJ0496902.1 putative Late embryogenesis abundant protein [Helianthus annuus]KAJ0662935.1 putative Late embryogenesis abundant protein [Helianthus annuus]
MTEEDQEKPLAPVIKPPLPPLTVDEELSIELSKKHKGFRNRTICCGIITAVILIISVVMLVLGFTVLHVKNPKINMNSVTIIGLDRVNITDLSNVNLTVVADVSVKNPNVAAFKFEKSNSSLLYHGKVVGVADIPVGIAKARRTMRLNVTVDVMVAEIARNQEFVSDLMAGMLPVESYTKIHGRVKILNIIKRHVTVTMDCSFSVNVTSREIVNQTCKKHVSI